MIPSESSNADTRSQTEHFPASRTKRDCAKDGARPTVRELRWYPLAESRGEWGSLDLGVPGAKSRMCGQRPLRVSPKWETFSE